MASANVFTDTEFCLACEKALKGGVSYYCDDVCRAREAEAKVDGNPYGYNNKAGESPLIFASLPPLIASQVHAHSMARKRSQGASASNSSHSENSSPLQSPSPLTGQPITTSDGSPREEMFLPPPAFQNPHQYMSSASPVKVPVPYQTSLPAAYVARQSSYKGETTTINDSTLHYGRRPAQTNSMTSPLALYPVGNTRRRESQGTVIRPRPAGGLSPAMKPSRVVSDTQPDRERAPKAGFAYGMHSPLVLAANRRPSPPTSIIDFTQARPTYSKAPNATSTSSQDNLGTYRPTSRDVYGYAGVSHIRVSPKETAIPSGSMASTISERRKSFPAHLMSQQRPVLGIYKPAQPVETIAADPVDESPVQRGRSRQRAVGAVERESSRRGSRSSRGSDGSSRRRDDRSARLGYIPSPPRSHAILPPSSSTMAITSQASAARVIGANENTRNTFLGRDLSTIMASYHQTGAVQPRFITQDEEDDISEEANDSEFEDRGRGRRGVKRGSTSPKTGKGRRDSSQLRAQADKESKAAREIKKLFDEGVSVS